MKKTTALVLLAVLIVTSLFGMTACNTGHKHNLEHVTATPATCTENGNSEYWYCRNCNKYFADQSATKEIEENSWVIAATGHTFSDEWTFDDQYHWHKATCEHSDLTKDRQEHNLVDGECTICDYSVTKYTVTFVTNGGSAVSPMTTSVVNESPETTQEGYKFLGWYTDNGTFKNKVEFPYAPKSDITLYAKWEEIIVEPTEFTVTFVTNGGSEVEPITASVIETSPETTQEGYNFLGWYTDNGTFKDKVDFPYAPQSDITLYAKWEEIIVEPTEFTVTFVTNGGSEVQPITTSVIETSPVTTQEGYKFLGWYTDEKLTQQVTFPYTVTADTTLYAGWQEETPLPTEHEFVIDDSGCITAVNNITEENSDVVIPSSVNGKTVTGLNSYLFRDNQIITSLTIPDTVTFIGVGICTRSYNLTHVTLPSTMRSISAEMFDSCKNLTSIDLPQSLTSIGADTFRGTGISTINLPDSVKYIGNYAFKGCSKLTSIDLNKVEEMGEGIFQDCTSLTSVDFPNTLRVFSGNYMFMNCNNLTNVTLPQNAISIAYSFLNYTAYYNNPENWKNGVLYVDNYLICINSAFANTSEYTVDPSTICIADNAFNARSNTTSLKKVVLPEGLKRIGEGAFEGCSVLSDVNIPSTVEIVGEEAFLYTAIKSNYLDNWLISYDGLSGTTLTIQEGTIGIADGDIFGRNSTITEVVLPETLRYIGSNNFKSFTALTKVNLPASLVKIGDDAFNNCSNLIEIDMSGCSQLAYIGDTAFSWCKLITSFYIPQSVTYVGDSAFNQCTGVVNIEANSLPSSWNTLWDSTYGAPLQINWGVTL